jgi:hypothetical protein
MFVDSLTNVNESQPLVNELVNAELMWQFKSLSFGQ